MLGGQGICKYTLTTHRFLILRTIFKRNPRSYMAVFKRALASRHKMKFINWERKWRLKKIM